MTSKSKMYNLSKPLLKLSFVVSKDEMAAPKAGEIDRHGPLRLEVALDAVFRHAPRHALSVIN